MILLNFASKSLDLSSFVVGCRQEPARQAIDRAGPKRTRADPYRGRRNRSTPATRGLETSIPSPDGRVSIMMDSAFACVPWVNLPGERQTSADQAEALRNRSTPARLHVTCQWRSSCRRTRNPGKPRKRSGHTARGFARRASARFRFGCRMFAHLRSTRRRAASRWRLRAALRPRRIRPSSMQSPALPDEAG